MEAVTARNREDVPCESDEHKFRPEVYDAAAGDTWIEDECCTICGWSWADIADHEAGMCCCPGDHRAKAPDESGESR
jgi:hypothetical protein